MPKKVAKKSSKSSRLDDSIKEASIPQEVKTAEKVDPNPEGDELLFGAKESAPPKQEDDKLDLLTDDDGYVQIHHDDREQRRHSEDYGRVPIESTEEGISINFTLNRLLIERMIYWVVIIVLLFFFFFGSPLHQRGDVIATPGSEADETALAGAGSGSTTDDAAEEAEELEENVEEVDETQEVDEEAEEEEPEVVTCPSGDVDLNLVRVMMDSSHENSMGHNNRLNYIEIDVTNNDNTVLNSFYLKLSYEDPDSRSTILLTRSAGSDSPVVSNTGYQLYNFQNIDKCGGTKRIRIDSFASSFVSTRSSAITFTASIHSADDRAELASGSRTLPRQ
ncbi:MAG: hypothetical protein ACMXYE_00485 [Candidatus Woesearchaeota archaeon]